MTLDELITALQTVRPGAHWNLSGNTYEGLVWLDDPSTKPTAEELGL
jgi:hypothetical protein